MDLGPSDGRELFCSSRKDRSNHRYVAALIIQHCNLVGQCGFLTQRSDSSLWAWTSLPAPAFEPIPLSGSGLVYINSTRTLTSVGGSTNASLANTRNLYRFHPISLLPPIATFLPDVPNGYDFDLANESTQVFNNGTSPHFQVIARHTGANVLSTTFGQLVEITPGGTQVTAFDLSADNGFVLLYNHFDSQLGYKVTVFNRAAVSGVVAGKSSTGAVTVRFEFYQYANDTNVDALPPESTLPPQQFFLGGRRLKFNVRIHNWPFADPSNSLVLSMGFTFPSTVSIASSPTSFGTSYNFSCAEGSTTLNLLSDSVNDGNSLQPVGNSATLTTTTAVSLQLAFKYFSTNVFYDPDEGVVVSLNHGGSGGDGSSDTAWIIAVSVVVPVVVIGAVVVVLLMCCQ